MPFSGYKIFGTESVRVRVISGSGTPAATEEQHMLRNLAIAALLMPIAAFAQGSYGAPAAPGATPQATPGAAATGARSFYIMTMHMDAATGLQASANHPAEAYPSQALPGGGGLILRPPNPQGEWSMRAFIFVPSQIVVRQGDTVTLNFVDIQGPAFRIAVDGQAEPIQIRRGEMRGVTFTAGAEGTIGFRSLDHAPTMTGEVLVLPR